MNRRSESEVFSLVDFQTSPEVAPQLHKPYRRAGRARLYEGQTQEMLITPPFIRESKSTSLPVGEISSVPSGLSPIFADWSIVLGRSGVLPARTITAFPNLKSRCPTCRAPSHSKGNKAGYREGHCQIHPRTREESDRLPSGYVAHRQAAPYRQ
jgi:hypothetical protein